jgi:uncharacterized protein
MKESIFAEIARDILEHEKFDECKQYKQHGKTSVYAHSIAVARLSFEWGLFFKIADTRSLVRAALLHDFFLYDWHRPEKMWSPHGWTHPVTAAKNARTHFNVSDKEYSSIRTHMWPYTLLHPPRSREAWLLCLADKLVSRKETLFRFG